MDFYTTSVTANFSNGTSKSGNQKGAMRTELVPIWILCEAISAILSMLSLYVTIVLIRHLKKQSVSRIAKKIRDHTLYAPRTSQAENKRPIEETSTSARNSEDGDVHCGKTRVPYLEQTSVESTKSNSNLITNHSQGQQEYQTQFLSVQRNKERDRGVWLFRAIVICALVVMARCVVEQCLIFMGDSVDPICNYLTKAMVVLTALSIHCCHVFLWLRQLTFYSNPVLKHLRSKLLKAFSYAAYAVMPVTLSAVLVLFIHWRDYKTIDGMCMPSTTRITVYLPFGVLTASTVTIQILLSSLFLYPLIAHRKKRMGSDSQVTGKRKGSLASVASTLSVNKKKVKRDKLMACIKRVLYGATVGITTDVVGGLVGMFIPDTIPMFAYSVLYNLNIWLNVLCLIYTFANWRQMLFPWCCSSSSETRYEISSRRRRFSGRGEKFQKQSSLKRRNTNCNSDHRNSRDIKDN